MSRMLARLRVAIIDRPVVRFDEARGRVQVCDTSCRAAGARDRAVGAYFRMSGPR